MTPAEDRTGPIEISDAGIQVDAMLVAEGFGLDPAEVQGLMRDGQITSLGETGEGEDAGRFRATFYYRDRALRLTFDAAGTLLSSSRFPTQRTSGGPPA